MRRVSFSLWLMVFLVPALNAQAGTWQVDPSSVSNAPVHYAKQSSIKVFPVPVVSWSRAGLATGEAEIEEIKGRIIYPVINESKRAVSAILVEFGRPDARSIGVQVIWADGDTHGALITKNEKGHYDLQAYRIFFAKPVP